MSSRSPGLSLHHLSILSIVFLEYLQTIMVSFASQYISGGIDASPEEFSLAGASYAAVAVLTILSHRWLVRRLGYRQLLRLSLLSFAGGAAVCALSDTVPMFIAGRMLAATGGAAFFTASRVQVLHYTGKARLPALLAMPIGITLASALAPMLAAALVSLYTWRALFWVMLPLAALVDRIVALAVPQREPVEDEQPDRLHPWGILCLSCGMFMLQFVLERSRYDLFGHPLSLLLLSTVSVSVLLLYFWQEWRSDVPLISYASFASYRYWQGLAVYGFGYLVISSCNVILPIFMVQGLGFALQTTGWVIGLSSLAGIVSLFVHMRLMMRWPFLRRWLAVGFLSLLAFGLAAGALSQEVTLGRIGLILLLLNAVFMPFSLGTAAAGTFRGVNEKVFTHAYQVKNSMREVANATGLSIATILIQMRGTLHYSRLAEHTAELTPWYGGLGSAPDPWGLLSHPGLSDLARLSAEISRQSTLMACQDYFRGLCFVAALALSALLIQRRLA
jgi:MFS transporter, DHA2 family, multidrug resistance protein